MTSLRIARWSVLVLATATFAAGCSSDSKSDSSSEASSTSTTKGSDGKASAGALDCSKGDSAVKAALGALPKSAEAGLLGVTSCEWDGDGGKAAVNTATAKVYAGALEALEGGTTEPVSGVGDRAFIVKGFSGSTLAGTGGKTLWVVKGDQVYSFALDPDSGAPTNAQLLALAKPYVG